MIARKDSLLRQLPLAATLGAGFGTLWLVLVLWVGSALEQALLGGKSPPREGLVVRSDGTPLIESTPPENVSLTTFRDLNGRVQEGVDREDLIPPVYLPGEIWSPGRGPFPAEWTRRVKVVRAQREPAVLWYFVHDGQPDGSAYFVGYERVSNRLVGYLGQAGFRAHPVPAGERIPVRGEQFLSYAAWSSDPLQLNQRYSWASLPDRWDVPPRLVHVPSGNELRVVDLGARTVTTTFRAPEPIVSVGVPSLGARSGSRIRDERPVLVRTRRAIYSLDREYKVTRVFTPPAGIERRTFVYWHEAGNGAAVVGLEEMRPPGDAGGRWVTGLAVYQIGAGGAVRETSGLTLQTGSHVMSKQAQDILLALGLPAPALHLTIGAGTLMENGQGNDYPAALATMIRRSWPALAADLVFSSALALIGWRRLRAFGRPRRERVAWGVFVLLLGLPAFVGLWLSRRWPVRERCPHCHLPSVRDRAACAACGTRFPAPALQGIEIFA
jgi:hypothetical protein